MRKIAFIALCGLATVPAFAINLITNGDFSSGTSNWTLSGLAAVSDWSSTTVYPGVLGPGGKTAWLGGYNGANDSIQQTIDTGTWYATSAILSFDLWVVNADIPGWDFLNVTLGGTSVFSMDLGDWDPVDLYGYVVNVDVTGLIDGSGPTDLVFNVTTDPFLGESSAFIGNVALDANLVPEPASMAAIAVGAAALLRRRRKA